MKPARLLLLLCAVSCHVFSIAQCLPAISDTAACTGTEPLAVNNEIIGAGVTRYFYGAPATFSSIRVQSGGKLIVCGTLQVNDFGMQGGTLVITRTGRLTINTGGGASLVFNGGASIYNTGFFKVLTNMVLDGPDAWTSPAQPNIMWNGPGATFDMAFTYFVLEKGNCFFVNKGNAKLSGIITNTLADAASVCLGNMSRLQVMLLDNKRQHAFTAPEGPACVFISNWGYSVQPLTAWPSVYMCRGASYCAGGCDSIARQNQKWGAATLFNGCASCAGMFLLPSRFKDASIKKEVTAAMLSWRMENLPAPAQFMIQRSANGVNFQTIDSLPATAGDNYRYADRSPLTGRSYYRILLLQPGAADLYSHVLTVFNHDGPSVPVASPNPFGSELTISIPAGMQVQEIRLLSPDGTVVQRQTAGRMRHHATMLLNTLLKPGTYIAQVITRNETYNLKVLKQ